MQELFTNCTKISSLYENVRMREELGKELSEKARKRLLKSEYNIIRDIRTSLHIARLGPGEGKEYRDKVMTEASRSDFEATFSDPKAFKWFMRSLSEVNKSRAHRRPSSSNSFRGGTGPYRPPRNSRGPPNRRKSRGTRQRYNRPVSSSRYRSSYRGGSSSGRPNHPASRFQRPGANRRFGSAPKGRRRQRF